MKVHPAYIVLILAPILTLALYLPLRKVLRARPRDPVEYYRGFTGYRFQLPLRLSERITQEEAEALAAAGHSYYVAHYGPDGRLLKAVKMLNGKLNFEHAYLYSSSGRLMSAAIARADGTVNLFGDKRVTAARMRRRPAEYAAGCEGCSFPDAACALKGSRCQFEALPRRMDE